MPLPAHHFLDARGIPYRTLTFAPTTEKGAASVARVLGFEDPVFGLLSMLCSCRKTNSA